MRIIAHRGASAYEPENTMRAFERALALGADWVELDVRLTVDGHAVASHADDLAEATDGQGLISRSTLAQVRACNAGKGEGVPALAEVLERFRGRLGLYLELKAAGTPAAAAALLRAAGVSDNVALASFDEEIVREAGALCPDIPTAILTGETDVDLVALGRRCRARFIHLCWEQAAPSPHELVSAELISHLNDRGFEVVVWHEERPEELQHLVRLPVWGICTNTPDVLARILSERL